MTQSEIKTRQAAQSVVTAFFETLSASSLLKLANALQRSKPDPERLLRKVLEATEDAAPPRRLVGRGLGDLVSLSDGKARLEAIAVDGEGEMEVASELLGAGDMAARLGVARTSLDNWRRSHRVLALRKGVRNHVFPVRQFEHRAPLTGIDKVRAHFVDDETAWDWLVTPNHHTGGGEPVEWLRKGKIDPVVRAAEGAQDYQ